MKQLALVCIAVSFVMGSQAEMRTWVDYNGTKLQAELVECVNGKVTLQSDKGKSITVSISSLSADDQKYVLRQTPPDVKIDMHDASDTHNVGGGYSFDFDRTTYNFRLELEKEGGIDYAGTMTAETYIIGYREVKDEYFLLKKSAHAFSFAEDDEVEMQLGSVSLSEVDGNIQAGTEYAGYLVVLVDGNGRVFQTEGSRSKFEEHARVIRQQSEEDAVSGADLLPLASYGVGGYAVGPDRNHRGPDDNDRNQVGPDERGPHGGGPGRR